MQRHRNNDAAPRRGNLPRLLAIFAALALVAIAAGPAHAQNVLASTGKITFLRVHDVGSGWGPASDFLDVEVVVRLSSQPTKAFGFQLRDDANGLVHQGMLDLLRDAFNHDWTVTIDYAIEPTKNNGKIIRVALQK